MSLEKRERYQFSVIRERMKDHPGQVLDFALGDLQQELIGSLRSGIESDQGLCVDAQKALRSRVGALGCHPIVGRARDAGEFGRPAEPLPSGRRSDLAVGVHEGSERADAALAPSVGPLDRNQDAHGAVGPLAQVHPP